MYDNEFETKENKLWTKDKIKPQQTQNEPFVSRAAKCAVLIVLWSIVPKAFF